MMIKDGKMTDEYIEAIWILRERGSFTIEELKTYFGTSFDRLILDQLVELGLVRIDPENGRIGYTDEGEKKGRKLIRAHRLAERLLFDVLHIENYEIAACEFEHIIDTDLIDGICTLLGHPRRCPDGLPIPEGACCRNEQRTITSPSMPLDELLPEQTGRVVAVNTEHDHQLHLLQSLQIRPGAIIRIHQRHPSFVVECDGSTIALDEQVARSIYVWKLNEDDAQLLLGRQKSKHHGPRGPYDCGPGPRFGAHRGSKRGRFFRSRGPRGREGRDKE